MLINALWCAVGLFIGWFFLPAPAFAKTFRNWLLLKVPYLSKYAGVHFVGGGAQVHDYIREGSDFLFSGEFMHHFFEERCRFARILCGQREWPGVDRDINGCGSIILANGRSHFNVGVVIRIEEGSDEQKRVDRECSALHGVSPSDRVANLSKTPGSTKYEP